MNIYLSGPMTGIAAFNYPAFEAATKALRANGHFVVSPHENGLPLYATWGEHMASGIDTMIALRSYPMPTLVQLPFWENSNGARLEHALAVRWGWRVRLLDEALALEAEA